MKKLSLALDDLCVETFQTAEPVPAHGTVHGQVYTQTCGGSCVPTCGNPPATTTTLRDGAVTDPRMCCL
jgi:hypothetical protein